MPRTVKTENIPTEAEADRTIGIYESDGCTATKEKMPDGTWTVTAECPD